MKGEPATRFTLFSFTMYPIMKIAILSPFYPYRGGIAQFSAMLYDELGKEHQVKAFNFKRLYPGILFPGKTQYVDKDDQAEVVESVRTLDSINPFSYFATEKALREFAPDLIIISYWMSFFVPGYAHIANRMKKSCKVVALLHNAFPHEARPMDKPLAKLFFNQCHGFITLSENVKNDLHAIRPAAPCMVSPHPLYNQFGERKDRSEACTTLGLDPDKKTLLFFGLIRHYKGLDLLIEAMSHLDNTYQLVIAGECYGSFDKYQHQIDASGAKERIRVFNRYINDNEISDYFSAADALILPYRSATQSGVVSIAYHFDTPMISTPVGDFPASIDIPKTGIVTSAITAQAIEEAILTLFKNDQLATCLKNIETEKKALSWETFADKIIEFSTGL